MQLTNRTNSSSLYRQWQTVHRRPLSYFLVGLTALGAQPGTLEVCICRSLLRYWCRRFRYLAPLCQVCCQAPVAQCIRVAAVALKKVLDGLKPIDRPCSRTGACASHTNLRRSQRLFMRDGLSGGRYWAMPASLAHHLVRRAAFGFPNSLMEPAMSGIYNRPLDPLNW